MLDDATRIRKTNAPAPNALPSLGAFRIVRGPDARQVGSLIELRGEHLTIGRNADNYLALNDPEVSGNHASLVWAEGKYVIQDLKSTNGTHVNGAKIIEHTLSAGDQLLLGSTVLAYQVSTK